MGQVEKKATDTDLERTVQRFEKEMRRRRQPSILLLLACVLFFAVFALWLGLSATLGDALWFLPVFQAKATAIDLYWDGQKVRIMPGSAEYDLLQGAIAAEFGQVRSYADGAGLSDSTLDGLRQQGRLLEVYFASFVRVHSWYNFGASDLYYIPLQGFNAQQKRIFNAGRGAPLQLKSLQRILTAAETVARQKGMIQP